MLEISGDWVEVEVVNWERYNPRADRKKHTWFRVENTIATEPKFFGLSAAQRFAVVCILAEVSKSGGQRAKFCLPWLSSQIGLDTSEIVSTIQHLVDLGFLRLPSGNRSVSSGSPTIRYDTIQKKEAASPSAPTNSSGRRTKTEKNYSPGFEEVYQMYPEKKGKAKASKTYEKTIKSLEDRNRLIKTLKAYVSDCETKKRFFKDFSSFMNQWKDIEEDLLGEVLKISPQLKKLEDLEVGNVA